MDYLNYEIFKIFKIFSFSLILSAPNESITENYAIFGTSFGNFNQIEELHKATISTFLPQIVIKSSLRHH